MVQAKPKYVRNVAGKLFEALAGVAAKKWENSQLGINVELGNKLNEPYCQ